MAFTSRAKHHINNLLAFADLRIETKTAERNETERLLALDRAGHFREQAFPVLTQIVACDPHPVLEAVEKYKDQTVRFSAPSASGGGFSFSNDYFSSSDAEVAYALIRLLKPKRILEVGSGNSTHLFREAIKDGELSTRVISIDPSPRREIETVADEVIRRRLEDISSADLKGVLEAGDILFIDSSHEIRPGNDVVRLFLNIVPRLRSGIVIHVHDIFLPFEYPREWIIENTLNVKWAEQYLLQAMLQASNEFEVLWPGYFLQRTLPGFSNYFHDGARRFAASFWLRKLA
jgi:predicted O-methyltransferase YrrM